jgi:membrane-bound metal-dependent hydrolase YbcI (DUF457 family)
MMSPEHSISGALAGYVACLGFEGATGIELHWTIPHLVAAITAGWANWPDCDSLKSTVTTSLGIFTRGLHHLVTLVCVAVYFATRTDKDPADEPITHRGATHTWPGALVMGGIVAVCCALWPHWAVPIVLSISLHWATRGIYLPTAIDKPIGKSRLKDKNLWGRIAVRIYYVMGLWIRALAIDLLQLLSPAHRLGKYMRTMGRSGAFAVCCGVGFYLAWFTPTLDTRWAGLLGCCVVLGILVHMLGDSVTESGICWLFPFIHPRTGRRWEQIKLPKWLAFKTGRAFEYAIVAPLCLAGCVLAAPGGWKFVHTLWAAWRPGANIALALPFATCPPLTVRTAMMLRRRSKPVAPPPPNRPAPRPWNNLPARSRPPVAARSASRRTRPAPRRSSPAVSSPGTPAPATTR